MAICPEIEIFTDEDPFIYYARWLVQSFKNTYGTDKTLRDDGKTFFEFSSENYDHVQTNGGRLSGPLFTPAWITDNLTDLSSVPTSLVLSAVDWDSSLPLYIKGPGWGDIFDGYSTDPWDVRTESRQGWFDLDWRRPLQVHQ